MDESKLLGGTVGTIFSAIGAGLSVTEIQAIVSIIATIIGLLITITTAIIIPVWKKIRDAKADGKITPEEVEDITNTLSDGIKSLDSKDDKEDK